MIAKHKTRVQITLSNKMLEWLENYAAKKNISKSDVVEMMISGLKGVVDYGKRRESD